MKSIYLLLLLILALSCNNEELNVREKESTNNSFDHRVITTVDSITNVDIIYHPSFSNSSTLKINRLSGECLFTVDTTITFSYGIPDTLKFQITDIPAQVGIDSFWSSSFIHSIRQDTSLLGWADGFPVFVAFVNQGRKDTVYLGNVHTKRVDSILRRQIDYLKTQSTSKSGSAYLKQLDGYF